jgi:hypothetical protein
MNKLPYALLAAVLLVSACGGDDNDNANATPASTTTASAAPTSPAAEGTASSAPTVTAEESAWLLQVCAFDQEFYAAQAQIPRLTEDPAGLTASQRRERAEIVYPALAAAHEAYVEKIAAITPPSTVQRLHDKISELSEVNASELRRSLNELDTIFASTESIEANNARIDAALGPISDQIDDEFAVNAPLRSMYQTVPECEGPE